MISVGSVSIFAEGKKVVETEMHAFPSTLLFSIGELALESYQ